MNDFADFLNIEDFEKFEKDARVNVELQCRVTLSWIICNRQIEYFRQDYDKNII